MYDELPHKLVSSYFGSAPFTSQPLPPPTFSLLHLKNRLHENGNVTLNCKCTSSQTLIYFVCRVCVGCLNSTFVHSYVMHSVCVCVRAWVGEVNYSRISNVINNKCSLSKIPCENSATTARTKDLKQMTVSFLCGRVAGLPILGQMKWISMFYPIVAQPMWHRNPFKQWCNAWWKPVPGPSRPSGLIRRRLRI